jgi:hypothetical protein
MPSTEELVSCAGKTATAMSKTARMREEKSKLFVLIVLEKW